jgi:hypothetical protein
MHFHLPKPLHGWRAFVGEVGIIVLGVSIALGAEQAVETMHHRAQVHEMTNKLRAESTGNRQVLAFDTAVLRKALADVQADIVALNWCNSVNRAGLQLLARPRYFLPENAAWLGLRDSALLPLMPDNLARGYWILDVSQSFLRADTEQANNAFVQAAGAMESVRGGASDKQICNEALISLERLEQAELALLQRTQFNSELNGQVLRGERLGPPREVLGRLVSAPSRQ